MSSLPDLLYLFWYDDMTHFGILLLFYAQVLSIKEGYFSDNSSIWDWGIVGKIALFNRKHLWFYGYYFQTINVYWNISYSFPNTT